MEGLYGKSLRHNNNRSGASGSGGRALRREGENEHADPGERQDRRTDSNNKRSGQLSGVDRGSHRAQPHSADGGPGRRVRGGEEKRQHSQSRTRRRNKDSNRRERDI